MNFVAFFVSLATKVLCFLFGNLDICAPDPTCENSRRVNINISANQRLGSIDAFCSQPGTTLDNFDEEGIQRLKLLEDPSNACDVITTRDASDNIVSQRLGCFLGEVDFCCPEEDSVAFVEVLNYIGNFYTLEVLALVSDEPPELETPEGGECESTFNPSSVTCEINADNPVPQVRMLFKF